LSYSLVEIHPAALEEAQAAAEWYRQRSVPAAEMFLDEIERSVDRIRDFGEQCPPFTFGTRRLLLRRFPFAVVFRALSGRIEIIAFAHARRRPGYWRTRVE
jgi:plasmid stabilization system protein ParE